MIFWNASRLAICSAGMVKLLPRVNNISKWHLLTMSIGHRKQ